MSTPQSQFITRQELADALTIHPRTTYAWMKEGMPSVRRDGVTLFQVAAVEAWIQERELKRVATTEARARKELAHAVLMEQTVAMRARDLVPRAELEKAWRVFTGEVAARLRRVPRELSHKIIAARKKNPEGGVEVVEQTIHEYVHNLLTELAEGRAR